MPYYTTVLFLKEGLDLNHWMFIHSAFLSTLTFRGGVSDMRESLEKVFLVFSIRRMMMNMAGITQSVGG